MWPKAFASNVLFVPSSICPTPCLLVSCFTCPTLSSSHCILFYLPRPLFGVPFVPCFSCPSICLSLVLFVSCCVCHTFSLSHELFVPFRFVHCSVCPVLWLALRLSHGLFALWIIRILLCLPFTLFVPSVVWRYICPMTCLSLVLFVLCSVCPVLWLTLRLSHVLFAPWYFWSLFCSSHVVFVSWFIWFLIAFIKRLSLNAKRLLKGFLGAFQALLWDRWFKGFGRVFGGFYEEV